MDEEDSQDELINRNISHAKGKRPAMSIISDDEDEGESEEGATGSEEDDDYEEEEVLDGEEEDDSEDEDSGKVLEGAVGSVAVDAAGLSSDEDSEKCPICLNSFHEQPVATPESCEHYFCLDCILEWSNHYNATFDAIIPVKKPVKPTEELVDVDLDQTSCEVCGGQDREDRLLLCDGCDDGYHMECLTPPLDTVPVEEWFCPVCIAHNRTSGSEQISEEESSSLPTTSRRPSRPTHAIARTQHSERVRANVNRRRITQARTAAQLAPRYMMQSTWLDETINAVVAGFNTAVYVRDLTPRSKSRRRRKTGGKTNMGVKRWKRKVRKSKLRRKLVIKKETSSRGRIARSLGIKKPKSGSMIPSVYQPSEYSLGSMRAEIGAASLSPTVVDEIQVPTPSSVLDAKRRGLSCSALRSHQPVARPISAGLSRGGVSVPQVEDVAEEAPVSDLLGSILSGQSMLLMDSSDVVINRDGSLKATKPVSLCLPINTQGSGETGDTPNSETSLIQPSGGAGPSSSPLRRPPPAHSSPGSCSTPQNSTSPPIHFPHLPHSHPSPLGHPHLLAGAPHRPITLNPPRPGNSHLSTNGIRSQPLSRVPNGPSDSPHQDKEGPVRQPPVRKPPPKPVWVDVSVLPRIPKIKRDSTSSANSSSGSSTLPGSSANSLAGNRERTVDQQGTGGSQQNRTVDAQRQRADSTGASSSFSSSFTSTTSSFSASSNSRPSSSSISFRINSSGNPWQAQRLPASGGTLPGGDEEAIKRNNKSKRMLLSLRAKAKEEKSEVYDPFNPTGSDSSDNEPENEGPDISVQNTAPRVPIGFSESACHQIKSEPLDVHSDTERGLEMCAEVKAEPEPLWDRPCKESPHHSDSQAPAGGPALDSTSCEEGMDTGSGGTPGSPFQKTEEHSRSSWSCSEINVKVEVKPQSKSLEDSPVNLQQASKGKGNGVCKELPSVSGAFNSSNIAKDKEERPHQSQSKDRKRSPSNSQSLSSKDSHKKKHSKLKEKRRSRSRSRDRQRSRSKSRSRSKERRRLRSRDRRCSSSSSSRERKTSGRRASHERNDNRGRERRRKRSKERRRSRSRSFSRSRERRRKSTFQGETKLKRQRSRSTSRERKRREERSEISRRTERSSHKSAEPMSTELHESALRANKTTTPVKTERDARPQECETTVVLQSVKQETTQSVEITAHGLDLESPYVNEIKSDSADLEKSHASLQDEMKVQEMVVEPKKIKIENIWPDEDDSPSCSDNPLVINLDTPAIDAVNCIKEPTESYHSPLLDEDMEMSPLQPPDPPIKQELGISSDEDISVDYLIDNLDFIKKEMSESSVADSTEAVDPKSAVPETPAGNKQTTEIVTAGAKSKSQGKRVTWNLQEQAEPQSENLSKLALFKLKFKQEGSRRSATTPQNQDKALSQAEPKLMASVSSLSPQDESSKPKSHKEVLQDPNQKDKYIKKLHMQERAIEEVKLAIKPFYQKRDITKEEYKEILRKAVQKVCHSKSGEINPVKVANLVKAYVDKYKHAKKHKKEETVQSQHTDSQTPM
uniref:PHD and RING finger domain-containing protein 1-like n=1 Tax=Sinocyclocheilus rhinocerous TaxID=307959 RepID=A0A673N1S5_9TELE